MSSINSMGPSCSCVFVTLTMLIVAVVCNSVKTSVDSSDDNAGEYCQLETMNGRCRWKSEVIVMTSARWGRMKTGRCLAVHPNALAALGHDPLFLGCSADVLSMMDRKCSGRSECDVRIPDADLDPVTPCYPDLTRYLEAEYTCVKVVQESRSCVVVVTSDEQFISSTSSLSEISSTSGCGTTLHPWCLEAPVGQRINISLLDFSGIVGKVHSEQITCNHYGYVVEKFNRKNVSLCATIDRHTDDSQREHAVYTSSSNALNVVLTSDTNSDSNNFLIRIHAIGCTNMIPPDNAWLKRSDNDVIIGCYLSQQTWQLKCDGQEWKGQVGTCPDEYLNSNITPVRSSKKPSTDNKLFLVMVIVAGGAVIVCIIVVTIGILCLQRLKQRFKLKKGCSIANNALVNKTGENFDSIRTQ